MGRREKKTGKGRLDKWYQLAKEQGYRARSAFKLVQLNKKYDFLRTSRCVIDLCAAPGGWCQVAAKNMPQNSLIIGVDLVPIKPIPRVVTLVEDITTESCRKALRTEMKDWKADVVLHDGAPNVGAAWVQDAFTQVELVLSSLKLATEFLDRGGTFVTKVFRSKDYNSLMWVFNQLFSKVEATKPPSSRNVSAEIFVVCQGYLAPAKIDPKFLNPKHVFSELDTLPAKPVIELEDDDSTNDTKASTSQSKDKLTPTSLNVFKPEKKRRQRDGYDDNDTLLGKQCSVSEFIRAKDPVAVLGLVSAIRFDGSQQDNQIAKHPLTTADIKTSCQDLKTLGKKDFKTLLKYRLAIRQDLGLDVKVKDAQELTAVEGETAHVEPIDEEEQIDAELERLTAEEAARRRKERRRANEKKQREVQRMQLNMVTPMDIGMERMDLLGDEDMFDLGEVERPLTNGKRLRFADQDADDDGEEDDSDEDEPQKRLRLHVTGHAGLAEGDEDEEEEFSDEEEAKAARLEASLDAAYEQFQNEKLERDAKRKTEIEKKRREAAEGEWGGIGGGDADDSEDDESEDDDPAPRPESDSDDSSDDDEEEQDDQPKLLTKLQNGKSKDAEAVSKTTKLWFDQPVFKSIPGFDAILNGTTTQASADESDADFDDQEEMEDAFSEDQDEQSDDDFAGANETFEEASDMEEEADLAAQAAEEEAKQKRIEALGLTTAEAMTLAQQLVNREKTKTQLIDDGFNRHSFNVGGDGLPTWFLDDEQRHFRHNIPITKDAVNAIREKMRALNARPIKKVAEAKARKKLRAIRRIEKTRAKAQGIHDDDEAGMTEKEKASQIAKVLAKSGSAGKNKGGKSAKKEVKLVVAKGSNKGIKGRPSGTKGKYKIVDSRMKKEVRALKRIAKRDKKKRK